MMRRTPAARAIHTHFLRRAFLASFTRWAAAPGWERSRYTRMGLAMFLRVCSPRSSYSNPTLPLTLIMHHAGDADPSSFRQGLEPGGDVHPIPVDPAFFLHHIPQADPHAEFHLAVIGELGIPLCQFPLHLGGRSSPHPGRCRSGPVSYPRWHPPPGPGSDGSGSPSPPCKRRGCGWSPHRPGSSGGCSPSHPQTGWR